MVDLTKLSKQDLLVELAALHNREQALKQHQQCLEAVVENALDAIMLANDQAKYVEVNAAACELLGYSRTELLHLHMWDLTPVPNYEQRQELWQSFLANGQRGGEYSLIRKDGRCIEVEYRTTANILPGLHLSALRDITDYKRITKAFQASEPLRISQALLDSVLSSSLDGISVLKAIRNEEGQIVDFEWVLINPRAETIIGRTADMLIGRRVLSELGPIKLFEAYARVVETGEPLHTEVFFELGPISSWIDVVAVKLEDGVAITFRDITRQKEAQQAVQQLNEALTSHARELATANRELHEFSYLISHDLRAPLRAINGFAQIISRRYQADLNEEARHYLNNILEAGSRMERLIDDLLIYSRLGRPLVQIEPVDLKSVLDRAAGTFATQIQELRAVLIVPEETTLVLGDRSLLERIFTNLFDNALKYHRPGIPPVVEVMVQVEDKMAMVSVHDNGIGISREHQEDIFDVFHRLHPPEAYPGTGIGLAIIRKSVQLMRGEVSIESTPGEGSVFRVKLPLTPEKQYN
jgi:PAS domain S-box-containing protein